MPCFFKPRFGASARVMAATGNLAVAGHLSAANCMLGNLCQLRPPSVLSRQFTSLCSVRRVLETRWGHASRHARHAQLFCSSDSGTGGVVEPQPTTEEFNLPPTVSAIGQVISAQANFVRVRVDSLESPDANGGGGWQTWRPGTPPPRAELLCVVRALLKKMQQRVLVGDRVRVLGIDWTDARGMVEDVLPRTSELGDPAIANVDHVALVFTFDRPPFEPANATRYLVAAEAAGLPVTVVLNKADLVGEEQRKHILEQVESWGYSPVAVSVVDPSSGSLEELQRRMQGRVSVLAGPSGAGKSSIINALRLRGAAAAAAAESGSTSEEEGGVEKGSMAAGAGEGGRAGALQREVAATVAAAAAAGQLPGTAAGQGGGGNGGMENNNGNVSAAAAAAVIADVDLQPTGGMSHIGRGKHTTRHVSLLGLPGGGLLADTPGFNQADLWQLVGPGQLAEMFPEMRERMEASPCTFSDCAHLGEPGCSVAADPPLQRYHYYVDLYHEVKERYELEKSRAASKRKREGNVRYKARSGGHMGMEVRLESKSHRRENRRGVRQRIGDLLQEDMDNE